MATKAKLKIVKVDFESTNVPDNIPLEEIHKYTIEQLIGRSAEQNAKRIIFDFPEEKVEFKRPQSVLKRMLCLSKK